MNPRRSNRFSNAFTVGVLAVVAAAALADTTGLSALVLNPTSNDPTALRINDTSGNAVFSVSNTGTVTSSGVGFSLANGESINTTVDATFAFVRNTAGTVTLTSADTDATAALTVDPGGNAALTLGSASDTIAIPVTAGIALSNSESVSNGTDGTVTIGRNDAGTVTLNAKDDDATAALTVAPGGAAALTLGTASTTAITLTTDGTGDGELTVPAASINQAELTTPGRSSFSICGDAVTVNGNTVYYGPGVGITSSATVAQETCDSTAAGNTTEATADSPAFTAQAFQVVGMRCRDAQSVAFSRSFTLRNNAGATVPSVTCTMGSGVRDCVSTVQTTTAIASGNPVAVAVASASDVTTNNFMCTVDIAF